MTPRKIRERAVVETRAKLEGDKITYETTASLNFAATLPHSTTDGLKQIKLAAKDHLARRIFKDANEQIEPHLETILHLGGPLMVFDAVAAIRKILS